MTEISVFFILLVILFWFPLKSETKDFCEAFKENGYRIDYSLEYFPFIKDENNNNIHVMDLLVVIGTDYWVIKMDAKITTKLEFRSKQSQSHKELGGNYSAAFLHYSNDTSLTNIVGFIRSNGSKIDRKVLKVDHGKFGSNNYIEFEGDVISTDLKLPKGFIPSAIFVLLQNNIKYFAFVDQKPESDNSELFRRRYVVLSGPQNGLFPNFTSAPIYDKSFINKKDLIIGAMAQYHQDWPRAPIIYSREGDILYCFVEGYGSNNIIEKLLDSTFEECSETLDPKKRTERRVLIQCPFEVKTTTTVKTKEESKAVYYVMTIIVIAIVILLVVCYFLYLRFYRKDVNPFAIRKKPTKGVKFEKSKLTLNSAEN